MVEQAAEVPFLRSLVDAACKQIGVQSALKSHEPVPTPVVGSRLLQRDHSASVQTETPRPEPGIVKDARCVGRRKKPRKPTRGAVDKVLGP